MQTQTTHRSSQKDWREHFRGAVLDARGNEIPITESMIRHALREAENVPSVFTQARSQTPSC